MTDAMVMEIGKRALIVTLELTLPILTSCLMAGLIISIFQAVTQVQEFTLTFIPKILAAMLAVVLFGPWMLNVIVDFTTNLFVNLPNYIK